ncbi:uncharacterized protein MELLADRAFT_72530 [Melampsora larici-populina 98AG31]|uniref:Uncharacterized protein n=1 Tax=Melampsora larici-populina (strain 98AG31 / pathotype 3-4-7) TaxID=747676 RepID=F4RV73_MELLP|nr:uncharacterized protein MELLADRAFT_72530 [Melampsora larici-populina 98AG31]EGG03718.1 hypothetical protein MELLADRAFT_72530 [Melampsora larici-populina 98AG31]
MATIFELPLPNFLIDPQDGEFTPYDARSLADPSESSDPSDHQPLNVRSPNQNPSYASINTITRSRATSDALEKLLAIQAQQLAAIGQAWRAKYSLSSLSPSKQIGKSQDGQNFKPNNSITRSVQNTTTPTSTPSKQLKDKSWMAETGRSVISLSSHASTFDTIVDEDFQFDDEEVEQEEQFNPITQATLKKFDENFHPLIFCHRTFVLEWLKNLPTFFDDLLLHEDI